MGRKPGAFLLVIALFEGAASLCFGMSPTATSMFWFCNTTWAALIIHVVSIHSYITQTAMTTTNNNKQQIASTCGRTWTTSRKPLFQYKLQTIKKLSMASPTSTLVGVDSPRLYHYFLVLENWHEIWNTNLRSTDCAWATPQLCQDTGDPNPERWSLAQRQVREKGLPLASAAVAPGKSESVLKQVEWTQRTSWERIAFCYIYI